MYVYIFDAIYNAEAMACRWANEFQPSPLATEPCARAPGRGHGRIEWAKSWTLGLGVNTVYEASVCIGRPSQIISLIQKDIKDLLST